MVELKPCPFCGVVPTVKWEPWIEKLPDSGCYVISAEHKISCYISHINGINTTGRISSSNKEHLIDYWNTRI